MATGPIKVLLVDDHALFREGLATVLKTQLNLIYVGGASTLVEAVEQSLRLKPDVVLMDDSLPDGRKEDRVQVISFDISFFSFMHP